MTAEGLRDRLAEPAGASDVLFVTISSRSLGRASGSATGRGGEAPALGGLLAQHPIGYSGLAASEFIADLTVSTAGTSAVHC